MENLLENNFDILAGELFGFPRNNNISYIQFGSDDNGNSNNNGNDDSGNYIDNNCRNRNIHNEFGSGSTTNTATNIKGNRQLYNSDYNHNYQQHHRHIGHSRSDSILSDMRNNSLGVNAIEGQLNGYKGLRDAGISSRDGSFAERNSSNIVSGIEVTKGSFDEVHGMGYNSNYDVNSINLGRLDGPFLDIDRCYNSINKRGSAESNNMCSYNDSNYVDVNRGEPNSGASTSVNLIGTMRDSYLSSNIGVPLTDVNSNNRLSNGSFVLDEGSCVVDLDSGGDGNSVVQFNGAISQSEGGSAPKSSRTSAMRGFHINNGNIGQFVSNFDNTKNNSKNSIGRYSSLPIDEQMMKMGICGGSGNVINSSRNNNDTYVHSIIGNKGGGRHTNSSNSNYNNSSAVHSGPLQIVPNSSVGFGFRRDSKAFLDGLDGCDSNHRMGLTNTPSSSSPNCIQRKMSSGHIGSSNDVIKNNSSHNSNISSDVTVSGVAIRDVNLKTHDISLNPKNMCIPNSVRENGKNDGSKNNCTLDLDGASNETKMYEFSNVIEDGDNSVKTKSQSNCSGNNNGSFDSRNIGDGDIYPSIDHFISGNLTQSQILSMLCGENFVNDKQSTKSGGSGSSTNGTHNLDMKLKRMALRGNGDIGGSDGVKVPSGNCYPKMGNIVDTKHLKGNLVGNIGPGGMVAGSVCQGGMFVGNGGFISKYDSISLDGGCSVPSTVNTDDTQFEVNNTRDNADCQFSRLMNSGGTQYLLDSNGNNGHGVNEETDFGNESRLYWDQRHKNCSFNCSQDMMVNMGSVGYKDWKSQQCSIFDRYEFTDDFGGEVLYNNNMIFNKQQIRQKYFGQQSKNVNSNGVMGTNMGLMNNGYPNSTKQMKQAKRRSGGSGSSGFEINQGVPNSLRMLGATNGYIQKPFNENILRSDLNSTGRHYCKSGRNGSGGVAGVNVNNGLFNGNNIGSFQQHYGRKTCPPNCPIQGHNTGATSSGINNSNLSYRRKSSSNNTVFVSSAGGINNTKFHGDFNGHNQFACTSGSGTNNKKGMEDNNGQFFVSATGNEMGRKGSISGYRGIGIYGNTNNSNIYSINHHGNGMLGVNGGISATNNNYLVGNTNPDVRNNDTSNNDNSQNELTPSSIAALWAKAMSKTGGRTGFNNRNSKNHCSNASGNDNGENTGSVGVSTNDNKKQNIDVVTCARFSSFLRNNSGRLHWLRVLYHYLDTVDIKKVSYVGIEDSEKDGTKYMVAIDDIAVEAVSKSFDPSECAYWSEPENGAFVHKNIRLAVAHKVGHRTVSTPQNYVNQILTASLDHSVSVLLNTLRAIDDRVRWMSTVVGCKSGGGMQIDLKLNRSDNNEGNPDPSNNNNNPDELGGINANGNETGTVSSFSKNFPGRVFTVGVREAMRCLRHRKLKALIVAPDIEGDGVEGSLRHHVIHILLQAQELNIPTIFALNRHRIGRAMGKHMRMSVLGLLSIRGVEKQFQSISQTSNLLKKLHVFCVENNLPPTEETFKRLSSTINEIK
ncbi:SECIS binding pelota RNA binding domain containing [Cryptosporidium bovis]|uniref:SECIS binding pelota RNA binding domain containing n=1 Tax=Cryptosporidium bovis TaxID=310047 RepID=UPI00351AAB23|nr:SECIS binding pelota RNA binding domain containing [Cryptosporidium bovis]